VGGTTDDNAIEGIVTRIFKKFISLYIKSIDIINCTLQRKCKTVQKLEGATQKSLDEEIKSTDNISIESTSQKLKTADEDSGQAVPSDAQPSINSTLKKDSKLHCVEEAKEKCSCSAGNSANVTQNEQSVNVQEKDSVDSAVEAVSVTPQEPENVPNDKTNGT